ncbi:hypothetical protein AURDEDRAFT_112867 [Auricularia subglabra TFB-10046 SS5]|nr:hypothetical protein AURDEDRAFT_112867 [Auricularia subglabra TFB-10046 SS5]
MYYFVWQTSSPMHQLYSHALALGHEPTQRPRAHSHSRSRAPSTSRPSPTQDKLAAATSSKRPHKARGRQQPPPNQPPPTASARARPRRRGQKQHAQQQQGAFRVYRDRAPSSAPAKQPPPPPPSKQWSAADVPPGLETLVQKGKAKRERDPEDDAPPPPRTPLAPLPQGRPRANSFYLPKPPGAPAGLPPGAFCRPRALSSPTSPVFRTPATTGAALAQAEAAVLREGRCRLVAGLLLNRVRARPLCPARRLLCYAAPRPYVPSRLSIEVFPV